MFNRPFLFLLLSSLLVSCTNEEASQVKNDFSINNNNQNQTKSFILFSNEFTDGGAIPSECACNWLGGKNRPPQLRWNNAPPETVSFTLLMEDETRNVGDKATKHWSVFNMPASMTDIDNLKEQVASGVTEGLNYTKKNGYAGPCPPKKHFYTFTIYALNKNMPFIPSGKEFARSQFKQEFNHCIIDTATITGTYKPSKSRLLLNKIKNKVSMFLR